MPTFEISLSDGRKFHVDAADQDAAQADLMRHLTQPQQSGGGGVLDAARQGAASLASGLGETGERYFGAGKALKDVGEKLAPQKQADTTLYDEQGFHPGNIPNAIAESSPSMAAALTAARLTPGPIWAKLAAGGLVGLGSMAGNYAKEATKERTGDANAPSINDDLVAGAARAFPEAAIQALPIGHLIGGPTARLGLKGVAGSLGRTAIGGVEGAAAGAGANAYDQAFQNGAVDPTQAINAGLQGGATVGAFGAGRLAQDAKAAYKYRGIANEAPEHIAEAANRVQAAADDLGVKLSSPRGGYDALGSAQTDVGTESKAAVKALKANQLSPESEQALARAQKGFPLSDADFAALNADTNNNPAVADLQRLGGVSRALEGFANTGYVDAKRGTLTGGLSGAMGHHVRAVSNPLGAGISGALATSGGAHLGDAFAHSPEALAALGGGYTLARLSDWATGNRSPAYAAVKRFATDAGVPAPAAPQINNPVINGSPGLQALASQAMRLSPTGPKVAPPFVSPWAPAPNQPPPPQPQPTPNFSALKPAVQAALRARMGALNMGTAPDLAPQAAPTPDMSGMRGAVQDAIRARMNVLKMQNAQSAPAPVINPQVDLPPAKITPQVDAPAPAPDLSALVPQVTKLTKKNGQIKQKVEQKPSAAPAETPAPAPRPVAEPQAPAPQGPLSIPEDLSIPEFLRRDVAAPVAATKAMAKLNAGPQYTPVPKGEMKDAKLLKMSHEDYADYKLAQKEANGNPARNPVAYREATIAARTWKEGVAEKLAKMFPQVGNKDFFFAELENTNVRAPIRQLREHLKAIDPSHAKEVDNLLSETQLTRVWAKVGANR